MGKAKNIDRFPDKPPQNKGVRYRAWLESQVLLFHEILRGLAEGVIVMKPDFGITFVNPSAEELLRLSQTDLSALSIEGLFCDERGYDCGLKLIRDGANNPPQPKLVHLRDNPNITVEASVSFLKVGEETVRIIIKIRDVSFELAQKKKLKMQAETDRLTGCFNRWWFEEEYVHRLEAARGCKSWIGLIFIDLDGFKRYNDESFLWGDRLIKMAADIIRSVLRPGDSLVRPGGDEFVLLCLDITPKTVMDIALRIQTALRSRDLRMPRDPEQRFNLTASIGVSVLNGTDERLEQLLDFAQDAKRQAKLRGKNCIVSLPDEISDQVVIH